MLIQKQYKKINFTANLDRPGNTAMFFIIEEAIKTHFISHKELRK